MSIENEDDIQQALLVWAEYIQHKLCTPVASVNVIASFIHEIIPTLLEGYELAKTAGLAVKPIRRDRLAALQTLAEDFSEITQRIHALSASSTTALTHATKNKILPMDKLLPCETWEYLSKTLDSYPFKEQQRQWVHYNEQYYFPFRGNPIFFIRMINCLIKKAVSHIEKNQTGEIFLHGEDGDNVNLLRFRYTGTNASDESMWPELSFCKVAMENMGGTITCHPTTEKGIEFVLSFPKII